MSFTTYPYDTVVYITDTIDGVGYQGSGVLISPNEVLTASHVVYSSTGGSANDITVTPGYDGLALSPGSASPYGSAYGTYIHYFDIQDPDDTISTQQSQYDYAVIHLSTSFPSLGHMGIESNYVGGEVDVTGYPAVDDGDQITEPEVVSLNPSYTVYDGTGIGAGSSGGPIWIDGSGGPSVIGLVSSANELTGEGYFTQITTSALDTIESWVQEDDAPCFLQGTRIATPRGEVPVEALTTGDVVCTRLGEPVQVVWLGHRRLDCRRHPRPRDVWPVRVGAHAFGRGRPRRDLWLSPDHAIFTGGALIPIRYLVNGATIVQEQHDTATYWHVELARHGVLLAEGLAAESYLDTGNRNAFQNGGTGTRLHPDFARGVWQVAGCAPLAVQGRRLTAVRRRLLARAVALGHGATDDPDLRVIADGIELAATVDGPRWSVRLPLAAKNVRLVSRVWVPAHVQPDEQDTRRLGVAVSRLWLDGREASPDSAALSHGWHACERHWRWTDGAAEMAVAAMRELAFEVAMTGCYWLAPPQPVRSKTQRWVTLQPFAA